MRQVGSPSPQMPGRIRGIATPPSILVNNPLRDGLRRPVYVHRLALLLYSSTDSGTIIFLVRILVSSLTVILDTRNTISVSYRSLFFFYHTLLSWENRYAIQN